MYQTRRVFLRTTGRAGVSVLAILGGLDPGLAEGTHTHVVFETTAINDALAALGTRDPTESSAIVLRAPDIAENSAVVPVEVESRLPHTRSIAILVTKNPRPLSAEFAIPEGTEPFIATRIKIAESALIHAVVKTDAGPFYTAKFVKVTMGGCGG